MWLTFVPYIIFSLSFMCVSFNICNICTWVGKYKYTYIHISKEKKYWKEIDYMIKNTFMKQVEFF